MPRFRPLPVLTVFTLASLVLLVTLGGWQMQRMAWKSDLITAYEARGAAVSFREAICSPAEGVFSPPVTGPVPLTGQTLRLYTLRDTAGWMRLALMRAPACAAGEPVRYLLVEVAFEDWATGERTPVQNWRVETPPTAGLFTPGNDPDTNAWYSHDAETMATALGVDPTALLDVWARADNGMPLSLSQTPPAKHLGYALTWYGLALALIGVYLALHASRGRLRLSKPSQGGDKDKKAE
ncbi:SURF1 family protein [Maricaulis maris]|uniref:SURF1-like protein n=1 Tax=Maricaulis maris (strain MCS10) TaxID=394221 RepID=Q0AMH4_MARMM|nr:SURF1 family protein [Maricaulis maris]ABI66519.1 SURF1 family protein [Maricaulis maris MCS10]